MTDVVVIGAGIMSATLHALIREVAPAWHETVVERLPRAGMESSHAWNNAGTGHAGAVRVQLHATASRRLGRPGGPRLAPLLHPGPADLAAARETLGLTP